MQKQKEKPVATRKTRKRIKRMKSSNEEADDGKTERESNNSFVSAYQFTEKTPGSKPGNSANNLKKRQESPPTLTP